MSDPEIAVDPFLYRVSPFPRGTELGRHWCLWLRSTKHGQWVILRHHQSSYEQFLNARGGWVHSGPATDGYPFDVAVAMAKKAIATIAVGGHTYAEACAGKLDF